MSTTHQLYIEPSALAVGLSDEHLALFHEVMGEGGLRVHVTAGDVACERMMKALPQVVVATMALGREALAEIEDRAVAVGAVFLLLGERPDFEVMERQLAGGLAVARARFGRRSSMPPS